MEFGETLAAAIKREMREEFGIEIEVDELVDVADHILPEERQHWVSPTICRRVLSGEPSIQEPGKCSVIGWFSAEEVPGDLSQVTRINLAQYLERFRR